MDSVNQILFADKAWHSHRAYHNQPHRRRPRRKSHVEASISVARSGDGFGVAFVIYRAGQPLHRDFVLLKSDECLNEERAWLAGYMHICEWIETQIPDAAVYIVQPQARERKAA